MKVEQNISHPIGIVRSDRRNNRGYRQMLASVRSGELIRLRNGLYATPDSINGSMVDIEAIVPGGVLCLYSAWSHYKLTTHVPNAFYVAISRSRKIILPKFPVIRLVFQRSELLEIGKVKENIQGFHIWITDIERSVCDSVKYRNKIGIDVMNEIIDNYLLIPDRNLTKLTEYAKELKVYSTLYQILQIKL